jgi:hypothetical protein
MIWKIRALIFATQIDCPSTENESKCEEIKFICALNVQSDSKKEKKKGLLQLWEPSAFGSKSKLSTKIESIQ